MNQQDQPHVIFAGQIVTTAIEEDLNPTTVFNGLAIAASALLVDYVIDEDGNVDPTSLQVAINHLKTSIEKAAAFAVGQLKGEVQEESPIILINEKLN
jgi:hypothetical protein